MKPKLISFLLLQTLPCLLFVSFGQTVTYGTKQIGKWKLEYFPLNYYKAGYKMTIRKAPLTGEIVLYQEVNQYGQNEGLRVEMQTDFISPYEIYYYKNDVTVYAAYFFPNSTKAYRIVNKNLNDEEEGPQIDRHMEGSKMVQSIKYFSNGYDKANLPVRKFLYDANSELDGQFYYTWIYYDDEKNCL